MLTFSTLLPSPPPSFSESQISQSQELLLFLDVPAHVRSPVAMATHDPYLDSMMTTSLGSRRIREGGNEGGTEKLLVCSHTNYILHSCSQIVRNDRTLEQIVFPVPHVCEYLPSESKYQVLQRTKCNEQGSKVHVPLSVGHLGPIFLILCLLYGMSTCSTVSLL